MSVMGDDPPYLSVGTEVSAKYKGAFCEAKIKKVQRCIKCRVTYKLGLGTATITDDQIKGQIRIGALIEAKYNDRKDHVEATINKIQDCSQYTVVFDDGDITTLRRSALCLKSGRHFAESETLDQLPLTHPEHFGYPVTGRRCRRSRQNQDGSSDEDDDDGARGSNDSGSGFGSKDEPEIEPEIGKVVCVELSGDKKKKDNWFPGLIVSPNAQDTNKINVHEEYLVRSFRDSRFYTVPKKETTEFTKDLAAKVEHSILKTAVEKAIQFLEKNELPNHWDKDVLFGYAVSTDNTDSEEGEESPSSDDEPREEKDHVVATLYKFMDDRGTPINQCPMIGNEDIDLYKLFRAVYKLGGYNRVTNQNQWKSITKRLGFQVQNNQSTRNAVKNSYKKYLHSFEDFYRKLGCTMVNHPRGGRSAKQRPGRSLIRDRDRTTTPNQDHSAVKIEKEEEEKKPVLIPEEEIKKEKVKKETVIKEEVKQEEEEEEEEEEVQEEEQEEEVVEEKEKEEEKIEVEEEKEKVVAVQTKIKKKEESLEDETSAQESDINIDAGDESSSSERSQKSMSRLTPSSNNSGKTKIPVKSKDEVSKKKPVVEKKKIEPKKQEKKDDKEKNKEEDSTKTRSRSKDDVAKGTVNKPSNNPETRETRTPSRDSDTNNKKTPLKPKKIITDDELKKRGRKKKDTDGEKGKSSEERSSSSIDCALPYKGPVEIGDKLNVYYGPTHEKKVTYEAKVIDVSKDNPEQLYLVHYTGWNNRYDEWIKCSRIAHNYTQQQGRLKRVKTTPRPQTPSTSASRKTAPNAGTSPASQNRRRAQMGDSTSFGSAIGSTITSRDGNGRKDEREVTPTTRSMTPSPLISNALRTKSPASTASNRSTRVTRNADSASSSELSRRSRRTSGHADAVAAEETENEDTDSLESDASVVTTVTSRSRVRGGQEKKNRREARKRAESRMKIEDVSDVEEKEIEEPRRGRRIRKPVVGKLLDVKSEPESDEEQPKGRDFDLNQIRSELKGFDKAVKLEMTSVEQVDVDDDKKQQPPAVMKQEKTETTDIVEKKVAPEPEKKREVIKTEQQSVSPVKREAKTTDSSQAESSEDIYEFKEPEPFEFEVRNKRDSGGSGGSTTDKDKEKDKPKTKQQQRPLEDDLKSPKKRAKPPFGSTNTTPVKSIEQKSPKESSPIDQTIDNQKKKVRKIFKKTDDTEETAAETTVGSGTCESEESTSSKEVPKFFYSNTTGYKRKANFPTSDESISTIDSIIDKVTAGEDIEKSPKKRQPKTFGTAAAIAKANEAKRESSPMDSTEGKKKVRKTFGTKKMEDPDNDEDNNQKKVTKIFTNYTGSKALSRKDVITNKTAESHGTNEVSSPKKSINTEDDSSTKIVVKKKQKGTVDKSLGKTETTGTADLVVNETKKKVTTRKITTNKKSAAAAAETTEDAKKVSSGVITNVEEPSNRDPAKFVNHYSGPKGKLVATNAPSSSGSELIADSKQNRTSCAVKTDDPKVVTSSSSAANKEDNKSKVTDSLSATIVATNENNKQGSSSTTGNIVIDKKRGATTANSSNQNNNNKSDAKIDTKSLDFTHSVPQSLTIPAPLSARLPATASIEEKLSAAAVFRSKMKDTKKEIDDAEVVPRKSFKDNVRKIETLSSSPATAAASTTVTTKKGLQKDKDDFKIKETNKNETNSDKKKSNTEQMIVKKDPLTEIEVRKDPLLEVVAKKKNDDNESKGKNFELKSNLIPSITKTYGNQKKEKSEEIWKKAAAMASTSLTSVNETTNIINSTTTTTGQSIPKDYHPTIRKETIISKIKSTIDRDSVDSTDSSDSERRLTIIDNDDFLDDKKIVNETNFEKTKTKSSVVVASINDRLHNVTSSLSLQQESLKNQSHGEKMTMKQVIVSVGNASALNQSKIINKIEEDGENLNSLLCEEEIPGSPTPGGDSVEQEQKSTASGSQNLKTDYLNKTTAVGFISNKFLLGSSGGGIINNTLPQAAAQLSSNTIITTIGGGSGGGGTISQSSNIITMSSTTMPHLNIQSTQRSQQQQQIQNQFQSTSTKPQSSIIHGSSQMHHHIPHHQLQSTNQHQLQHSVLPMSVQQRRINEINSPIVESTTFVTPDVTNFSKRIDRVGGLVSSLSTEDNTKVHHDRSSSEIDNDNTINKTNATPITDVKTLNSPEIRSNVVASHLTSFDNVGKTTPKRSLSDNNDNPSSPKKRKKRKDQDSSCDIYQGPSNLSPAMVSGKKSPRQSVSQRNVKHGSDSDDDQNENRNDTMFMTNKSPQYNSMQTMSNGGVIATMMNPTHSQNNITTSMNVLNKNWNWNYVPRSKYQLLPEFDSNWNSDERIDILNKKIIEARRIYAEEQTKLAKFEKCLKKIKRKRREEKRPIESENHKTARPLVNNTYQSN